MRSLALVLLTFLLAATTRAQVLTWDDRLPVARHSTAMTYDSDRHVIVMCGGFGSTGDDTWEIDGDAFHHRIVPGPQPRYGAAMAYDSSRHRCVLFGGSLFSGSTGASSTWEWNGVAWSERLIPAPPARLRHGMVYDSDRNVVVLFGGSSASGTLADTWEYDGVAWTQRTLPASPSIRHSFGMVYDSFRHRTVLFGGTPNSGSLADTWEYDGITWTQRTAPGVPGRSGCAMAYDAVHNRIVLHGGRNFNGLFNDTWTFDGAAWTQTAANLPEPRDMHAMACDTSRGRVLLFGGTTGSPLISYSDSYEWDGAIWSRRTPQLPAGRSYHAITYDSDRHVSVLFGGIGGFAGTTMLPETAEWDGRVWTIVTSAGPPPRIDHALAYDSQRHVTVLFGGATAVGGGTLLGDTWEWDGTAWTQRTIPSPPARRYHSLSYDSIRHVVVLFSGQTASGVAADTWEFDGSSWTQRVLAGPLPAPRIRHRTSFDPVRGVTVLFGGKEPVGSAYTQGTWEYDGAAWTQRSYATGPISYSDHILTFDPARNLTFLMGAPGLWTWNGTSWTARNDQPTPPNASTFAGCFDAARGQLVCFNGSTWEYGQHGPLCYAVALTVNPVNIRACVGSSLVYTVAASGTPPFTYRWRTSDGGPTFSYLTDGPAPSGAIISGASTPQLTISNATLLDRYLCSCLVTNDCSSAASSGANARMCIADFNCSTALEVQDIFDFLSAWFASSPTADFNHSGSLTVADIFAFLNAWFAGCS